MEEMKLPLRVDFAGGWLDVPKFARPGAFIVNCAISPLVSLKYWPYEIGGGLGGSAAWHILNCRDCAAEESAMGVGWQDEAVIRETGLCVWKSGPKPELYWKASEADMQAMLGGRLALLWTGKHHKTAEIVERSRDMEPIEGAGDTAKDAILNVDFAGVMTAMEQTYYCQIEEGMDLLPAIPCAARKYCGAGYGGYAVYFFPAEEARRDAVDRHGLIPVEPYCK